MVSPDPKTQVDSTLDTPAPTSKLLLAGLLGGSMAAIGNLAVYAVARSAGVSLVAEFEPGESSTLSLAMVMAASFLPALLAAGVYALLLRFTPRATPLFIMLALAFGLVSMLGPITVVGADLGTTITLMVMHGFAALVIASVLIGQRSSV